MGSTGNKAHAVKELRHWGLFVYPFATPCPNTANECLALCLCVIRLVPPLYALPGNNGVFMLKDQQLFSHRTPQAVRPCRHVLLAVSCRHQDLECRAQSFSMGETKLFQHPWNRVTLEGRDGSREKNIQLGEQPCSSELFHTSWGVYEEPPLSHHQGCSSYIPSLSFQMGCLPLSPPDCTLQPRSQGCCQSRHSPAIFSCWTTLAVRLGSSDPSSLGPGCGARRANAAVGLPFP